MILLLAILFMQTSSPEQIVQKQLDTYNDRDIVGFMSVMSKEVTLVNFQDQSTIAKGFEEVKKIYTNLFEASPDLHSDLTNRIVLGNRVIDHETITGRMGQSDQIELVVIYQVNDRAKIEKITVLRP